MFCRYACEYCDSKFSSKASRKSHEKSNHVDGEGHLLQIDCKECEKKLPTSTHLRKHVTNRHGSNVNCKDCDKSFNKSGYKQHRTVAHVDKKEKVFKCNQCDYTSYASKYIRVHKLRLDTIEDLNISLYKIFIKIMHGALSICGFRVKFSI